MFIDSISSKDNPRIKEILLLQEKSKARREKGLFVVEGLREITHCIEGGFHLEAIFFCEELLPQQTAIVLAESASAAASATPAAAFSSAAASAASSSAASSATASTRFLPSVFALTRQIYEKIAYRDSTEGIIALAKTPPRVLSRISLRPSPLVLIFEGVEKPGNLGAVLRTADAAGVDAVLVCDPLTDIYNPNLIRASLGGVFAVQVIACSSEEAAAWLHAHKFTIYSAQLQDSKPYYDADMTGPTAIVFGTESTGLTPFWRQEASSHILIPMLGRLDSLNVSVSAAILCYEAVRQRNLSK